MSPTLTVSPTVSPAPAALALLLALAAWTGPVPATETDHGMKSAESRSTAATSAGEIRGPGMPPVPGSSDRAGNYSGPGSAALEGSTLGNAGSDRYSQGLDRTRTPSDQGLVGRLQGRDPANPSEQAFIFADADNDGRLTLEEFRWALEDLGVADQPGSQVISPAATGDGGPGTR